MEQRKRVYPTAGITTRILCIAMIVATGLLIAGGLIDRGAGTDFQLSAVPKATAFPLEAAFDETMTETVIELPETAWYSLQLGAFESEASAQEAAMVFQKRGAAGYLWFDQRYRVLAAVYTERDDAQIVREQLKDQHSVDSYLYTIAFPAVTMKLKGMQGQLDILRAAFVHASDVVKQLQDFSVRMDRQELSVKETSALLASLDTQLEVVMLRLYQRFQAPKHQTVEALLTCFEEYRRFVASFSAEQSAVSAGMKLKYQTFIQLDHLQKIYDTLGHT